MEKDLSNYRFYKGQQESPYLNDKDNRRNYFWNKEKQYHENDKETSTIKEYIEDWCRMLDDKYESDFGEHLNLYYTIEP